MGAIRLECVHATATRVFQPVYVDVIRNEVRGGRVRPHINRIIVTAQQSSAAIKAILAQISEPAATRTMPDILVRNSLIQQMASRTAPAYPDFIFLSAWNS